MDYIDTLRVARGRRYLNTSQEQVVRMLGSFNFTVEFSVVGGGAFS